MILTKCSLILVLGFIFMSFNGKSQLLNNNSENSTQNDQITMGNDSIKNTHSSDFKSGKEDAKEFYTDNKSFAISFFSSLVLPPVGLFTTIAISTSRPKLENLNVPNDQLLKNEQYVKGYVEKASRMKAGRSWGGCLTGLSFFAIIMVMIYPDGLPIK